MTIERSNRTQTLWLFIVLGSECRNELNLSREESPDSGSDGSQSWWLYSDQTWHCGTFSFYISEHICVRVLTYAHIAQSDRLTSCPQGHLACEKGRGALLFSLWFSYYTEINTVELFWRPRALDPERASTQIFCLCSLSLFQSPCLHLFHWQARTRTLSTRTPCYALIQALPSKQINKHGRTLLMHFVWWNVFGGW